MNDHQTALATGVVTGVVTGAPEVTGLYRELELPSGLKAEVLRRGTGKHLVLAERMAGQGVIPGTMRWNMALIAVKCRIGGKELMLEEVEELDDLDILTLVGAVLGKDVSAVATSPS